MTKKVIPAHKYAINKDLINNDALYIIQKLQSSGFDGYVVGGGIRDLLLNKRPKDFDIVTSATPEQVHKLFKRNSMIIGRRFKIVHIIFNNINPDKIINNRPIIERHVLEVSTYRSTKVHKHSLNEHGKILTDNNYGTQKEDATRRDFTINALFYNPTKEVIIDYHGGINDVENRQLKIIGNPEVRFQEDPVRMLRAIRLATKLDLTIDKNITLCFSQTAKLLLHENKSRLYEEMLKILLSGHACKCINVLKNLPLPKKIFPLFDLLFFKKTMNAFAFNIIEKTDLRLLETPDVSIVFILSGLLWSIVNQSWHEIETKMAKREALIEAIHIHREFAMQIGITKNTYTNMHEIWLLQFDLEFASVKRVHHLFRNSRFRQAWHLFSSRHEFGEVGGEIFSWWQDYITADNNGQLLLLKKLPQQKPEKKPNEPKKIKPNKNKGLTLTSLTNTTNSDTIHLFR